MKVPYHRFLAALCALSFLFVTLFSTAALAAETENQTADTLTSEDAAQMQLSLAELREAVLALR